MKDLGPNDREYFEDSDLYEEDIWERESHETEERSYDPAWDWDPADDHRGDYM
ncbi:hypothetical protein [Virgibacillus sp. DJP39]|uniref:hypothetical protein n=1 Tax=Virgibacillus sp. DJP39 TaxID=3409790 RepID=UPI003BB7361D